jgi:hypothetical protein
MKKSIKYVTLLLICVLAISPSCKKYEDGPRFSIYSKKERATGNWRFSLVRENGVDMTEEYAQQSVNMQKNGNLLWIRGYYDDSWWDPYGPGGTWQFIDDKNQIEMHFKYGVTEEFSYVWDITRLAYGDLQLRRYEGDVEIEWRMWKRY